MMPEDIGASLGLLIELLKSNNFRAVAALIIFMVVKFGGPILAAKAPFWGTAKGKASMVILLAVATGLFNAFRPGAVPSMAILGDALMAALSAAGGFSLMKPFMPEKKPSVTPVP